MSYQYQPAPLPELKSCLCGGQTIIENEQHNRRYPFANPDPNAYEGRPYTYYVRCQKCNLDTEAYKTKKQAINRWNNSQEYRAKRQQEKQAPQYGQPQQHQQHNRGAGNEWGGF